ncbi:MAG: hypothetical protein AAF720_06335 [Pseudomonadota bacterium]
MKFEKSQGWVVDVPPQNRRYQRCPIAVSAAAGFALLILKQLVNWALVASRIVTVKQPNPTLISRIICLQLSHTTTAFLVCRATIAAEIASGSDGHFTLQNV